MKIITRILPVFCFLFLLTINNILAQIPDWQWARSSSGIGEDRGHSVAVDGSGNVYVTGQFSNSSIIFGTNILHHSGVEDIYIVKYDPSGNVIWAKSSGGTAIDLGYGVTCDVLGNVYLTGSFASPFIVFGNDTLHNAGGTDMFLVKFDSAGNVLWSQSTGGSGDDFGYNIKTDDSGNLYVIGNFYSLSLTFGSTTLYANFTRKIFIVKYDQNGNVLWANGSGLGSVDFGKCVAIDDIGNVYIAGEYYDYDVSFGTDTFDNTGVDDIFIAKYNSSGNYMWATVAGGFNEDKVTGLVVDAAGNCFISGNFRSPFIAFGSTVLNNADFGAWDIFVIKVDNSGNIVSAQSATNNLDEDATTGIGFDDNNNLCVAGWYNGAITIGSTTITSNGLFDVFVAKYDTSLNPLDAISAGGQGQDFTNNMVTTPNGNIYITGFYDGPTFPIGTTTLTDANTGFDMFVAKLSDEPTSVNEKINDESLTIYPNPGNGIFNISGFESGTIKVFSEIGKCVYQSEINKTEKINLTALSKGIYFCKLIDESGMMQSEKIIIY
jgi:hypothetical protein